MKRALERLDNVHKKLLETVASLEPDLYSQKPAGDKWSVAENIHHLHLVESRVIQELENAVAQPKRRLATLRRLVPTSIVSSRLVRVKSPRSVTPNDAPTKEVAIQNLENTRLRLKEFCATYGDEFLRGLIFKHPFLGEIDGVATVSFIGYHEQRHLKQIKEVLRKVRK